MITCRFSVIHVDTSFAYMCSEFYTAVMKPFVTSLKV